MNCWIAAGRHETAAGTWRGNPRIALIYGNTLPVIFSPAASDFFSNVSSLNWAVSSANPS